MSTIPLDFLPETNWAQLINFLAHVAREKSLTPVLTLETLDECNEIFNELEGWVHNLSDLPARVHAGNTIYAKSSQASHNS